MVQPLQKTVWSFKKLKNRTTYDPVIPLLGVYPKELKAGSQEDICTPAFMAALFIIAKTWKQPKCPSTDEWINKVWSIYTMEYYAALKNEENFAICNNMDES